MQPSVQVLDPPIKVCLVGPPRQPVDPWCSISLEGEERCPQHRYAEMVEERGEPFLLPLPCGLSYARQRLGHAFPVLRPIRPNRSGRAERLITFVDDRPGHDYRYAIDSTKVTRELGWLPQETFESGLRKTVKRYLENETWWQQIRSSRYRGERLGIVA